MGKGKKKSKTNHGEKVEEIEQTEIISQPEETTSDVKEMDDENFDNKAEYSQMDRKNYDSSSSSRNERSNISFSNNDYRQDESNKRNQKYEAHGRQNKRFNFNSEDRGNRRGPGDNSNNRGNFGQNQQEDDDEFNVYSREFRAFRGEIKNPKTREITQDLFEMPKDYSLAHCVAEDMNMGSGIAVQFRYEFKRVSDLLNQHQRTGGLAILQDKERFIYYLVTKKHSSGKPNYETLFSSLKHLRDHVRSHNVTKIAMPRIGCGLDRLDWLNVRFMLEFMFRYCDIEIVICNLEPTEASSPQKHKNCKVTHETYSIETIDSGTVIIYFSSEDEFISEEMKKLDEKFHFLNEFRHARKRKGDVIIYGRNENYLLCGCIVKKNRNDPFDFAAFSTCLSIIQKENKKRQLYYYAFQAFKERSDSCINYKIINLLRNNLRDVEIYVCWPGDLINEMSSRDRYADDRDSTRFSNKSDESWRSGNDSFNRDRSPHAKNFAQSRSDDTSNWRGATKSSEFENRPFESLTSRNHSANRDQSPQAKTFSQFRSDDTSNLRWTKKPSEFEHRKSDEPIDWFHDSKKASKPEPSSFSQEEPSFEKISLDERENVETDQEINCENETNCEFENWQKECAAIDCSSVKEQKHPNLPIYYSRVCFASEDLMIKSAIPEGPSISAAIGKLLHQNAGEGEIVYTKEGGHFLYCLIVSRPNCDPTSKSIFCSIQKLRDHIVKNNIKNLVIPKTDSLGENLTWQEIKSMFQFLLGHIPLDMHVASFTNTSDTKSLAKANKIKLTHAKSALHQQKEQSVILLLASADGKFSEEMKGLTRKFPNFESEYSKKPKIMGQAVEHEDGKNIVYGCIVKQKINDRINFAELQKIIVYINERNKVKKLPNVAIQAIKDQDESVNFKIITVLYNCLQNVNIFVCWPGDLRSLMPITK